MSAVASRLFDYFAPTFSFGVRLDSDIAAGRAGEMDPSGLTATARRLIDEARTAATAAGKPHEQVEAAAFAVVAWFDEIVTRNPLWWSQVTPLQVELFNTNNAGNEFFEHLANLKTDEAEVREVYYHALLLGFVGQYYYESGNTGELAQLKELHGRQLPVAPAPTHTLREEKITQQPYQVKDPAEPRYPRRFDALLLKAGVVIAIAIPLAYLVWFFVSPAHMAGPTVQQLVDAQLHNYTCSDLVAVVDPDGNTRVSGYVSHPADLDRLHSAVTTINGVRSTKFDVDVRIWPHCAVIAMLKPLRERNLDRHVGLKLTPTTGHSVRFIEGEHLIVKLTQGVHKGYLYVDYYTVDGSVIHLFPNKREPGSDAALPAGMQFDVGAGGVNGRPWLLVGSPFGQELITVMSSPTPLYKGLRGDMEPAAKYLPDLQRMIARHHAAPGFVADYMIIQTEPAH